MIPGATAPVAVPAGTASAGLHEGIPVEAGVPLVGVIGNGIVRLRDTLLRGEEDAIPLPCPHLMKNDAGGLTLPRMKEADRQGPRSQSPLGMHRQWHRRSTGTRRWVAIHRHARSTDWLLFSSSPSTPPLVAEYRSFADSFPVLTDSSPYLDGYRTSRTSATGKGQSLAEVWEFRGGVSNTVA